MFLKTAFIPIRENRTKQETFVGIPPYFLNMNNFPSENIVSNKKPPTEQDFIKMLAHGDVKLPPIQLTFHSEETTRIDNIGQRISGFIKAKWSEKETLFVFEYKGASTPRVQELAMAQVLFYSNLYKLPPLIVVPYLSEEALRGLNQSGMSGVDLCGNGLLIAKDFRYWRSGQPNGYKDNRPIKNPFYNDSSIFARCFLLCDHFSSLTELGEFAQKHTFSAYPGFKSKALTQGTASKVIQTLIDEFAVQRVGRGIELQDRKRLLLLLRRGYRRHELPKVIGSSPLSPEKIWEMLKDERTHGSLRAVATGLSSAVHYKALSGGGRLALYVSDLNAATASLRIRTGKAFANIELIEDRKNIVYFDAREEDDKLWASPIQTWIELATGGPREQEAAQEIEHMLWVKQRDNS